MSELTGTDTVVPSTKRDLNLKKRYAAEKRFRFMGIAAIAIGLFFLLSLLFTVVSKGYTAFWQTSIAIDITFDEKVIDPKNKRSTNPKVLQLANYPKLAREALAKQL